jgi:hypothetical protein
MNDPLLDDPDLADYTFDYDSFSYGGNINQGLVGNSAVHHIDVGYGP